MTRPYSNRRAVLAELKKWRQRLDMLSWPNNMHRLWPAWFPARLVKKLEQELARHCGQEIERLEKDLNAAR